MSKLIINSDDFGYSRSVNHAIIDTYQEGILTSASLMANAPEFDHAVKLAKANPGLGIGVHLALTVFEPLRGDVPSLVDENNNFYRPDAYRTAFAIADLDELYKEWDTQIQKILDTGIEITHLNSHHNAHTFNEHHQDVLLDLAEKYGLPVRKDFESERTFKSTAYFEPSFDTIGVLDEAEEKYYLDNLIQKIKKNESTEILCHVGYIDKTLHEMPAHTDSRIYQVETLTDSEFAKHIREDETIELVTFAEI